MATSPIKKVIARAETQLLLLLAYIGSLIYVGFASRSLKAVLMVHLVFSVIYGLIFLGKYVVLFFVAPIFAIGQPLIQWNARRYLKKFKRDVPAEVVIVLGHSDWFKLDAWLRHNYLTGELKALVATLEAERKIFSFYTDAHRDEVERIMLNDTIQEVYFFGHGDSHCFQLGTGEILYYCDFNDPKYRKKFAHQIHCGTPHGKSLLDYVVPEENRPKCFFFRKPINGYDIVRELKKRKGAALQAAS